MCKNVIRFYNVNLLYHSETHCTRDFHTPGLFEVYGIIINTYLKYLKATGKLYSTNNFYGGIPIARLEFER